MRVWSFYFVLGVLLHLTGCYASVVISGNNAGEDDDGSTSSDGGHGAQVGQGGSAEGVGGGGGAKFCEQTFELSSRKAHTCALLADGSVSCWGANDNGQLGNGTNEPSELPTPVALAEDVLGIAVGGEHTCALLADGSVSCWGRNDGYGQLGNGTTEDSNLPVPVTALGTSVVEIAAGDNHTCALLADASVSCWGANGNGQVGNGEWPEPVLAPLPVIELGDEVAKIAAGTAHTCALLQNGSVACWGSNAEGQLGRGEGSGSAKPVFVFSLDFEVVDLAVGGKHTCATLTSGALSCWGMNADGQLGNGEVATVENPDVNQYWPIEVEGFAEGATGVTAGSSHTCARKADGTSWCWGGNGKGQLGDNTIAKRPLPISMTLSGEHPVTVVALARQTCLQAHDDGALWCTGLNDSGQLGAVTEADYVVKPVEVFPGCR